jgi:hemerythrin-like metal-binding protein
MGGPKLKMDSNTIDSQHKALFDLIKNLNNSIKAGMNMRVLDTLLSVLLDQAFQHFYSEEERFSKGPDYNQQCLKHYRMIKQLHDFIVDFRKNRKDGEREPPVFLTSWFQEHIKQHDRPLPASDTPKLSMMKESDRIDDGIKPKFKEKRRHRRVHTKDVVDGKLHVHCYNVTQGKNGTATIVDMSTGGLLLMTSSEVHRVDDLLIVTAIIGTSFTMKEKAKVIRTDNEIYGVQFIAPSQKTIEFFTKLYGAVYMRRTPHLP